MSLSPKEQQALASMEDGLADSDPKLASLLATFARLASDEEMPVREKIRATRHRATRRPRRNVSQRPGTARRDIRRLCLRLGWPQTMLLLLWLAVTIALVAVALVLNRGSSNGPCPEAWAAAACTRQTPAHSPRPIAHNTAAGQVLLTDAITWPTPCRSSGRPVLHHIANRAASSFPGIVPICSVVEGFSSEQGGSAPPGGAREMVRRAYAG